MEGDEKREGDGLADPAFVLLRHPVQLVGADGLEFGEGRVDDEEVEVVAVVGPDEDEGAEVGDYDWGGDVVEQFGGLRVVSASAMW